MSEVILVQPELRTSALEETDTKDIVLLPLKLAVYRGN